MMYWRDVARVFHAYLYKAYVLEAEAAGFWYGMMLVTDTAIITLPIAIGRIGKLKGSAIWHG